MSTIRNHTITLYMMQIHIFGNMSILKYRQSILLVWIEMRNIWGYIFILTVMTSNSNVHAFMTAKRRSASFDR